jgi:hypothetical protein
MATQMQVSSMTAVRRLVLVDFDWDDAEFRFAEGETGDPNIFAVNMRVEDILLRGAQRWDEMQRFRTVFNDPGIVLSRTSRKAPAEVFRNRMARRIFESINGERTVAEILLHAHGSEYLVTKFLYELFRAGVAEVGSLTATGALEVVPTRLLTAAGPLVMQTMRSLKNNASSTSCVTMSAVILFLRQSSMSTCCNSIRVSESNMPNGSSSSSILGASANATAPSVPPLP